MTALQQTLELAQDATGQSLAASPCSQIPNPGSDAAIAAGCTCPVFDNAHGRGYMGIEGVFIYLEGCPVHSANIKVSGTYPIDGNNQQENVEW